VASASAIPNQTVRSTVLGLFEEWHQRVEDDYQQRGVVLPYKVSEKDHKHWTYEPHVAATITEAMLDEAKVQVLTQRVLKVGDEGGNSHHEAHHERWRIQREDLH